MFRIGLALLVILATAAVAALVPSLQIAAILLGGGAAIAIASVGTSATTRAPPLSTEPSPDTIETALIEAIVEPILLVVDGRVRRSNAAARSLLGVHIAGEDVRLAIRHPAAASPLSVTGVDGATELIGLGGRDQRIQMQVATLAPGRRIVHLIDRTTNYAAERARVDFVANSSHELRTPLAAIIGFIETLDDANTGADPELRARFLSVMMKEARRMQRLIDDLISLSRIEAEKYSLPVTPIDLSALVREVTSEVRDGAGSARGAFELDLEHDALPVAGDRSQLSQVIHNLVGNALKYGRVGEPITITVRSEGATLIRASVTDRGEGIAAEHIPRLTERFYRVDASRSRAMGGTGLGLAIVKHIVERHRGRLEITSTVGTGTTVSVLLPTMIQPAVTEMSLE